MELFLLDPTTSKLNHPISVSSPQVTDGFHKILGQINDPTIGDEQGNRLKVAFAEGYLAANNVEGGQKGSKTMKYLKVFHHHEEQIIRTKLILRLSRWCNRW